MAGQHDSSRFSNLRTTLERAGCHIVEQITKGDTATRRWNGALDPRPALIARCRSASQVAAALRAASAACLPVSIHNGGQDWECRSLRDDTLVLDISSMASVTIEAESHEAVIGGGALAGKVNEAAGGEDLVAVIGNDGAVGMAGLIVGGGYGPLMTRFGLACDNLLSVEVALLNGRVVICDADTNQDLFWAIRGGGGNFAVVTSARIRLHRLPKVFAGTIVFAWADALAALACYADLMLRAPAELFAAAVISIGPTGKPVVVISLVWTGEPLQGEALVAEVASIGTPVIVKGDTLPASGLLSLTDGKLTQGRGYAVGTRWFRQLSSGTIEALIAGFDNRTSPLSSIVVHHCHGSATHVPSAATAFGMREPHFTALIYAAWESFSDDAADHREWVRMLDKALMPTALPGGYANLLSDTAAQQVTYAFGPNAARLAQIKAHYDPLSILNGIPLPAMT